MSRLKAEWTVCGGILLGEPIEAYDRRWVLTAEEWNGLNATQRADRLDELSAAAHAYARRISHPDLLNWVRVQWIWV